MPPLHPTFTNDQIAAGFGAFDEIEFLGSGSFGDTYRVQRDDDLFALKVLLLTSDPLENLDALLEAQAGEGLEDEISL